MHSVWKLRSIPATSLRTYRQSCRLIAGRRYPTRLRQFHASTPAADAKEPSDDDKTPFSVGSFFGNNTAESAEQPTATPPAAPSTVHGSASRRAQRNKKPKEPPRVYALPEWFTDKTSRLTDGSMKTSEQQKSGLHVLTAQEQQEYAKLDEVAESGEDGDKPAAVPWESNSRYMVDESIYRELQALCRAALQLPSSRYADDPATMRAHLNLLCHDDSGMAFLNQVARRVASDLDARVISLNAQDIAELCREEELDNDLFELKELASTIRYLGYDVYQSKFSTGRDQTETKEQEVEEEDEDAESQEAEGMDDSKSSGARGGVPFTVITNLSEVLNSGKLSADNIFGKAAKSPDVRRRSEDRWLTVINALLANDKTATVTSSSESIPSEQKSETKDSVKESAKVADLFVLIEDYAELNTSRDGRRFLKLLHQAVQTSRGQGSRIAVLGLTAQETDLSGQELPGLFKIDNDEFARTVTVAPYLNRNRSLTTTTALILKEDRERRISEINSRHIQQMIKVRSSNSHGTPDFSAWEYNGHFANLKTHIWSFDLVHRYVTTAVGLTTPGEPITLETFRDAIDVFHASDSVRRTWAELKETMAEAESGPGSKDARRDKTKKLQASCNEHEKKLLPGVVDARNIRTTFEHVHVPTETKDAIQELTSLSLIRPDEFTYGVLKSDRIPGLLLYGPPGTGKTLLAKAVANDSSCSVLEVSGAEINNKWVGEGEKNVKAIFTLAKKLSPCIIFIDEADSMLCSRSHERNRTAHHELINQFLKEWDGMTDSNAFIMVATNRPFDLDDAVLRRLPRRLLVDLPTEADRASIMQIHLREEKLADDVDLTAIATRTPLYSGSDLKNVCVAAALACVREETRSSLSSSISSTLPPPPLKPKKATSGEKPPQQRILHLRHFEKALLEISASVNEDMGTLKAIQKFDEKYGDRRGRKKKGVSMGFSPKGDEKGQKEEEWRVRG